MPYCIFCKDFFCARTMSSPAESCECGACICAEDARREYLNDREPTNDELEQRRAELQPRTDRKQS